MYEDIYPEKKKKVQITDFEDEELEIEITKDGRAKIKKKNVVNLYPKGQTVRRKKASKKARDTMRRAMKIRKYIKEDEKDKE